MAESARVGRRGFLSPLTRRILVVNVLALAILLAGLLYLGRYEQNLIASEIAALRTQGEIFAEALAEGAYGTRADGTTELQGAIASTMLRRLVTPTKNRTRLFDQDGLLVADSRTLLGPQGASISVSELPPPDADSSIGDVFDQTYKEIIEWLPGRGLPLYEERPDQRAADYEEVARALEGGPASALRVDDADQLVIGVAIPVKRFKQVIGAVFVVRDGATIEEAVRSVRIDILTIFAAALFVTVLLSVYLGSTIVRPLRRLAAAADEIRSAPGKVRSIPEFRGRNDEIGDLAADLNAMTDALSQRLDAIESFAADVAHELKNPLTSLRSAVETAARLKDHDQQSKLMEIIQDDVTRLDRLISDISDASRLDAELSRDETDKIDLNRLLAALVEVHRTSGSHGDRQIAFEETSKGPFSIMGNEGRVAQVLQNLITNAFSFSPPQGLVMVRIGRDRDWIVATIEDEGPGIPHASLEKIFDRFYSERPDSEQFGTHSGLGLSISRQIVAAHQGKIEAENRTDLHDKVLGARFIVRLPVS
ncbi:MAG: HAMP domain-containing protein [Alphaproteobacteria bacterium]|nr:HAMP domain-containing protein [Alphaproteobacteria bacterium]